MSLLTDHDQVRQNPLHHLFAKKGRGGSNFKDNSERKEEDLNIRMLKLWGRVDGVSITQNISYICPDKLSKRVEVPLAISFYHVCCKLS